MFKFGANVPKAL